MAHRLGAATHHGAAYVSEWVLGVVGLATAAMGTFMLVGGSDQYVGLGGDLSWRVGDIHPAWGWSFLAAGLVVAAAASMMGLVTHELTGHGGAHLTRARRETDVLLSHTLAFVLVNAFLWVQDFAIGSGLDYAYWVTIPWAVGLAGHAAVVWRARAKEGAARR